MNQRTYEVQVILRISGSCTVKMMNSKLLTCLFGVVLTLLLGQVCYADHEGGPGGDDNPWTANVPSFVECDEGFIFNPDTCLCYKLFEQNKRWHQARDICIDNNGVLAKVDTEEIKDWVDDVLLAGLGKPNFWIGLKDEEDNIDNPEDNTYLWRDGSEYPLSGSLWFDNGGTRSPNGNRPDNNCVYMRRVSNDYYLDDFTCNAVGQFLCCAAKKCVGFGCFPPLTFGQPLENTILTFDGFNSIFEEMIETSSTPLDVEYDDPYIFYSQSDNCLKRAENNVPDTEITLASFPDDPQTITIDSADQYVLVCVANHGIYRVTYDGSESVLIYPIAGIYCSPIYANTNTKFAYVINKGDGHLYEIDYYSITGSGDVVALTTQPLVYAEAVIALNTYIFIVYSDMSVYRFPINGPFSDGHLVSPATVGGNANIAGAVTDGYALFIHSNAQQKTVSIDLGSGTTVEVESFLGVAGGMSCPPRVDNDACAEYDNPCDDAGDDGATCIDLPDSNLNHEFYCLCSINHTGVLCDDTRFNDSPFPLPCDYDCACSILENHGFQLCEPPIWDAPDDEYITTHDYTNTIGRIDSNGVLNINYATFPKDTKCVPGGIKRVGNVIYMTTYLSHIVYRVTLNDPNDPGSMDPPTVDEVADMTGLSAARQNSLVYYKGFSEPVLLVQMNNRGWYAVDLDDGSYSKFYPPNNNGDESYAFTAILIDNDLYWGDWSSLEIRKLDVSDPVSLPSHQAIGTMPDNPSGLLHDGDLLYILGAQNCGIYRYNLINPVGIENVVQTYPAGFCWGIASFGNTGTEVIYLDRFSRDAAITVEIGTPGSPTPIGDHHEYVANYPQPFAILQLSDYVPE